MRPSSAVRMGTATGRFRTPNAAAYKGLGQTYVDDQSTTPVSATYDKIADGLAAYQPDAMTVYADARLT